MLVLSDRPLQLMETVVKPMQTHPRYLLVYLHTIYQRDYSSTSKYHDLQIELYAQFDK